MELVSDFHLHSRFSRAVSSRMNLSSMYLYAKRKGINLLTVSDFTHPLWFREVKAELDEAGYGVYILKNKSRLDQEFSSLYDESVGPYFLFSTEISCIYFDNGKVRRIHNLVFAPNVEIAEKINKVLYSRGFNLSSDGRPILGITSKNLYELLLSIDKEIIIVPCHVWTPHFGLYGSGSGYDSIEECFGEYSKYVYAVETGLSSDPGMNWRIKDLENRSIVSFSDAHSPEKIGREATVFKIKGSNFTMQDLSYKHIINAFKKNKESKFKIAYTIEFYPEEGKYHYTGHRNCGVLYSPEDVKRKGVKCPVCGKPLTIGVMDRVEKLAGKGNDHIIREKDEFSNIWIKQRSNNKPSYVSIVPLVEIIKEALSAKSISDKVLMQYKFLVDNIAPEFNILLKMPIDEIEKVAGKRIAYAIMNVRERDLSIKPGFDGEYGKVSIL